MPCESGLPRDHYENELRAALDSVTRLLCGVMRCVSTDEQENLLRENKELRVWWEKHEAEDRKRTRKEDEARKRKEARQGALKKLTPEERRLLGIS